MINIVPPAVDQIIIKEASRCIGTESVRERCENMQNEDLYH